MNVLISGATGLIGSALVPELEAKGRTVTRLSRSRSGANTIRWDPSAGTIDGDLEGTDAVVHLAGESIAQGRWNGQKKRRILESRVQGTRRLAERIAAPAAAPGDWEGQRERGIRESRVQGTRLLAERIASLAAPPGVVVSTSAVGYYGDR